jgi:hypothetical protein
MGPFPPFLRFQNFENNILKINKLELGNLFFTAIILKCFNDTNV